METVIPEKDDDLLPKCETLSTGTQTSKKGSREKGTQYKDSTIRKKFTQAVNVITYNSISTQTMTHPCTCLESGKNDSISKSDITSTEEKPMILFVYGIGL